MTNMIVLISNLDIYFIIKSSAITALNYNTALQVSKPKMAQVGLIEIVAS